MKTQILIAGHKIYRTFIDIQRCITWEHNFSIKVYCTIIDINTPSNICKQYVKLKATIRLLQLQH